MYGYLVRSESPMYRIHLDVDRCGKHFHLTRLIQSDQPMNGIRGEGDCIAVMITSCKRLEPMRKRAHVLITLPQVSRSRKKQPVEELGPNPHFELLSFACVCPSSEHFVGQSAVSRQKHKLRHLNISDVLVPTFIRLSQHTHPPTPTHTPTHKHTWRVTFSSMYFPHKHAT